jgi:hypothetical protein
MKSAYSLFKMANTSCFLLGGSGKAILFRGFFQSLLFFALILFGTSGCNDDLSNNLPEPDDKIVIDGWIETGQHASVLLTKNSPYFSSIDSASIRSLVLTRAKVTLSDGVKSETLILRRNDNYFPPYVFEGNEIVGDTGKTYTITAEYGGKKAWAETTIPPKAKLDTLYFKLEANSDSLGTIYLEFTDNPGTKDYYRILTKRFSKDRRYYSTLIMAINDNSFSGEKFGISFSRGPKSFLASSGNEYYKLADTVSIKFCTIDKENYDFWSSFQDEAFNTGNPFASSMSVIKSNVHGDGLGIWSGYGVNYYYIINK